MCHKFMIHPFLVVGRVRICCWKSKNMLLEEIGYVVEAVCIFGRTTAVVRQLFYDTPSSGSPSGLALQFTPVSLWNR